MTSPEHLLLAITWLMTKHMLGDFVLQSSYQFKGKQFYGHPGGLLHAGLHILLTVPVFWILPPPGLIFALAILFGEFVVHYHLDWAKKNYVASKGWTTVDRTYWLMFGLDQLAHGLTYVTILWLLAAV